MLPAALGLLVAFAMPVVEAIAISFSDWAGVGPLKFVGIDNFAEMTRNGEVIKATTVTLVFGVATCAIVIVIALTLATLVSRRIRGAAFYRAVWFVPAIAPGAATAVFFATSFQPGFGIIDRTRHLLGIPGSWAPLADPSQALIPVIIVCAWGSVGFAFLLLLGAMEQVDATLYEAADLDGATRYRKFTSITLPLIRPTLGVATILTLIGTINNFTVVFAMTRGGPGSATTTIPLFVYQEAFKLGNFGLAAAVSVITSIVLVVVGLAALKLTQSRQTLQ